MNFNPPGLDIIKAFNLSAVPIRLTGGQGTSFRVSNTVLKPVKDIEESSFIANINTAFVSQKLRVPRPICGTDGSWVFKNWVANEFVEGEHKPGQYAQAIEISKEFHKALVSIPKPTFFEKRDNVWAVADRIAWGELPFPDFQLTNEYFQQISVLLTKNELPNQLIHGDWGLGNIIFDKNNKPVVIDFSPYWRPADFAIAIMVVDAMVYEGADTSIIDLCKNIHQFDQLLLRALTRRICEYIGHQNHPENTQDRAKDIIRHLELFKKIFL